jgi:hypothetical protein
LAGFIELEWKSSDDKNVNYMGEVWIAGFIEGKKHAPKSALRKMEPIRSPRLAGFNSLTSPVDLNLVSCVPCSVRFFVYT